MKVGTRVIKYKGTRTPLILQATLFSNIPDCVVVCYCMLFVAMTHFSLIENLVL